MYKNILIPTDGSELAQKAVEHGLALAKALGARVTALTVRPSFDVLNAYLSIDAVPAQLPVEMEKFEKEATAKSAKILDAISATATAKSVDCTTMQVEHIHPYEAIIETAKSSGCDLICMASHGRGGAGALLLGSETAKVLHHTDIPVLVYR